VPSHECWKKASAFNGYPCPTRGCAGKLTALYQLTLSAPFPFDQFGFTKTTIKCKKVGIIAVNWATAQPFCPSCGWREDLNREATKSEAIMRLMRALIMRGVAPSDVQRIVGDSVSVIDVLAATHPEVEPD